MSEREKIMKIISKNSGVLLTRDVTERNISRKIIERLVHEKVLIPLQRGVYVTKQGYVDEFFLLQEKFKTGVYSHETALYLHGFSDRVPQQVTMMFRHGRSTKDIKQNGVIPVTTSRDVSIGMISIERNGQYIRVYDIEKTLVDLLNPRYDTDYEQFIPAIKQYAKSDNQNINKLMKYAKEFGVEKKIRSYMEVLL